MCSVVYGRRNVDLFLCYLDRFRGPNVAQNSKIAFIYLLAIMHAAMKRVLLLLSPSLRSLAAARFTTGDKLDLSLKRLPHYGSPEARTV